MWLVFVKWGSTVSSCVLRAPMCTVPGDRMVCTNLRGPRSLENMLAHRPVETHTYIESAVELTPLEGDEAQRPRALVEMPNVQAKRADGCGLQYRGKRQNALPQRGCRLPRAQYASHTVLESAYNPSVDQGILTLATVLPEPTAVRPHQTASGFDCPTRSFSRV